MNRYKSFLFLLCFTFMSAHAIAEVTSYDRYAAIFPENAKAKSTTSKIATDFLTYPLEVVRYPVKKALGYVDKYSLVDKNIYLFEQALENGVTPRFDGLDIDFVRLTRLRNRYQDLITKGWIRYWDDYFVVGGKLGVDRIAEAPIHTSIKMEYKNRPEEHFYGIGPDTSYGDGTSYKLEKTELEGVFGYSANPSFSADVFTGYKRVNITNGEDGGRGNIDNIFRNRYHIPGLSGDEIFSTGLRLILDKRRQNKGHLLNTEASFNEGLYNSEARFFQYKADWTHYLPLGSQRRLLVSRVHGQHSSQTGGHEVPFHQMARLGGFGADTENSETLRSYDRSRFFDKTIALLNLEYRYTIYEYRDWKLDTVIFFDEGQVFSRFSKFQFSDFRESYGGGFNLSILNNVVLSIQAAHGDEGTNFYVKSRSPF